MSKAMQTKSIMKKISEFNANLVDFENQFILCPYRPSGYTATSNFGQVEKQYVVDQFETYKRIWTGNDSFIVTWEGSCEFDNDYNSNFDFTDKVILNWGCGDAFLGWLESDYRTNEISTDTSWSEYKSQKTIQTLTFRINAQHRTLDDNTMYLFFKVPEISNQVIFRVASLEKEFLGRELMCYVLTLESVQDILANTGKSKTQNIMPCAPGQGYLQPQIVKKEDFDFEGKIAGKGKDFILLHDRVVFPNKTYQQNNPVKKVVVKAMGLCWLSNITFIGRRVNLRGDFREYGIQRLIFPMNFTNPSKTITLFRTQQADVNFYWMHDVRVFIHFDQSLFNKMKDTLEFYKFYDKQGLVSCDLPNSQATCPKDDDGIYKTQIYGTFNGLDSSGNPQFPEYAVNTYAPWVFNATTKGIDTSITYGCEKSYNIGGQKPLHDHMWDAYWTQKQIKTLPLTKENTLGFGWTVGAGYAAGVAHNYLTSIFLFAIGIFGKLIQQINPPKFQSFRCLAPASLTDFMFSEGKVTITDSSNWARLNYLLNPDSVDNGEIATFYQTATMNIALEAELTDTFYDSREGLQRELTTDMIGQSKDNDGNPIYAGDTEFRRTLLVNGKQSLRSIGEDSNIGFIIDSLNIQAIFKGDYSVEFKDINDDIIWTGVFQSEGKWTDTIREINTWKDTSIFNNENKYLGKPLKWPQALQDLDPNLPLPNIVKNVKYLYQFKSLETDNLEEHLVQLIKIGVKEYVDKMTPNRIKNNIPCYQNDFKVSNSPVLNKVTQWIENIDTVNERRIAETSTDHIYNDLDNGIVISTGWDNLSDFLKRYESVTLSFQTMFTSIGKSLSSDLNYLKNKGYVDFSNDRLFNSSINVGNFNQINDNETDYSYSDYNVVYNRDIVRVMENLGNPAEYNKSPLYFNGLKNVVQTLRTETNSSDADIYVTNYRRYARVTQSSLNMIAEQKIGVKLVWKDRNIIMYMQTGWKFINAYNGTINPPTSYKDSGFAYTSFSKKYFIGNWVGSIGYDDYYIGGSRPSGGSSEKWIEGLQFQSQFVKLEVNLKN